VLIYGDRGIRKDRRSHRHDHPIKGGTGFIWALLGARGLGQEMSAPVMRVAWWLSSRIPGAMGRIVVKRVSVDPSADSNTSTARTRATPMAESSMYNVGKPQRMACTNDGSKQAAAYHSALAGAGVSARPRIVPRRVVSISTHASAGARCKASSSEASVWTASTILKPGGSLTAPGLPIISTQAST